MRTILDGVSTLVRVQRSRRARRPIEDRAGVALSAITVDVLSAIHVMGPVRHGPVAERVGTQPSRVSKEVRALVEAGFVRESPDPDDRRAVLLRTTRRGAAAYARYLDAANAALTAVIADWSDRDVATLAASIDRLADAFRRELGPDRLGEAD